MTVRPVTTTELLLAEVRDALHEVRDLLKAQQRPAVPQAAAPARGQVSPEKSVAPRRDPNPPAAPRRRSTSNK